MFFVLRIIAGLLLLYLAVADVRTRRLPTRPVLLIAALYGVDAALAQVPWTTFALHFASALLCFGLATALFACGWMGGGDVKLASAIALWAGFKLAAFVFAVTSLAGLVLAGVALAIRAFLRRHPTRSGLTLLDGLSAEHGVPYGVALAAGGLAGIVLPALLHPL